MHGSFIWIKDAQSKLRTAVEWQRTAVEPFESGWYN